MLFIGDGLVPRLQQQTDSMEFLSAASETVANADAIAAAAATLSARLPGAAASDSSGASSAGTSPRPNNNNDSEIEGEGEVPSTRFPEGNVSVAAVVAGLSGSAGASMMVGTGISPAARDAHAKLEKQAEEIRNGTCRNKGCRVPRPSECCCMVVGQGPSTFRYSLLRSFLP